MSGGRYGVVLAGHIELATNAAEWPARPSRLDPGAEARSFSIESRSRSRFSIEHDPSGQSQGMLFGKPVSTLGSCPRHACPDHVRKTKPASGRDRNVAPDHKWMTPRRAAWATASVRPVASN